MVRLPGILALTVFLPLLQCSLSHKCRNDVADVSDGLRLHH